MGKVLCGFFFVLLVLGSSALFASSPPERDIRGLKAQSMEEVLALPEEEIDLATAALILAREAYRDLYGETIDIAFYQRRLDEMAASITNRAGGTRDPEKIIATIGNFFKGLGFAP
ncbi:MAG: hypothetical protein ABDK93_00465, partial [Atribacterota bacterium]